MRYVVVGVLVGVVAVVAYQFWPLYSAPAPTLPATLPTMATSTLKLTSPVFADGGRIPDTFTCDGDKTLNPPLAFSGVPKETQSLVLIMDDPDVPLVLRADGVFDHWVVFDIPPTTTVIPEGGVVGTLGANSAGAARYTGPCPPPQFEPSEHRYVFTLYALDAMLSLREGATKVQVLEALAPHAIAKAQLVGVYSRK